MSSKRLNRRQFIRNTSLSAAAGVLGVGLGACSEDGKGQEEPSSETPSAEVTRPDDGGGASDTTGRDSGATERAAEKEALSQDILVIGAGMAGLTAASALVKQGYKVVVLEGRGRLGGRIHTDASLGFAVERGAQWINGNTPANPVAALAQTLKLETITTDFDDIDVIGTDGKSAPPSVTGALTRDYESIVTQIKNFSAPKDRSVKSFIDAVDPKPAAHRYAIEYLFESEFSSDVSEQSVKAILAGKGFQGNSVMLKKGYGQLIEHQAKGLDIQREQVVNNIDTTGPEVIVTTDKGKTFKGRAVVLSVPLGVLKSTNQRTSITFSPALPEAKQKAIQVSGFGLLNKVYIRFKKAFWPKTNAFFHFIPQQKDDFTAVVNLLHSHNQPVLTAFVAASFAKQMESWSESKIIDRLIAIFQKTGLPVSKSDVEKVFVTQWGQDPFSFGCYSFNKVGEYSWRKDLAAPVGKRLFFAGEACSEYSGTVEGAYLSGIEAAKQIKQAWG